MSPSGKKIGNLSATDRRIVEILSVDPQVTNKSIAQQVGISEVSVANRIVDLISTNVLRFTIQRNIKTLGYNLLILIELCVRGRSVQAVADELGVMPEAISVSLMIDEPQIILLLAARDISHLTEMMRNEISAIDGVVSADPSPLDMLFIRPGLGAL